MTPSKSTRLSRAKNERMYFMGRAAQAEGAAAAFIVSGQSGKIWTVTVPPEKSKKLAATRNSMFRCNCPDNLIRKGTCKHMIFVCLRILKIPENQLQCVENGGDLDISLIHEALDNVPAAVDDKYTAPAALKARLKAIAGDFESGGEIPKVEPRLPEDGDSCPICYEDLLDGTTLEHCNYGCGKPVHKECFARYTVAQKERYERDEVSDSKLKCVTCRTDWVVEPTNSIGKRGMLIGRRAINLAEEMPEQFLLPTRSRSSSSSKSSKAKRKMSKSKSSKSRTAGTSSKRVASSKAGVVRDGRVTKQSKAESSRNSRAESKTRRSARLAGVAAAESKTKSSNGSARRTAKSPKRRTAKRTNSKSTKAGLGGVKGSRRTRSTTRNANV